MKWFPLLMKHPCDVPSCFIYAIIPSGNLSVVGITVCCFLYIICLSPFLMVGYCLYVPLLMLIISTILESSSCIWIFIWNVSDG